MIFISSNYDLVIKKSLWTNTWHQIIAGLYISHILNNASRKHVETELATDDYRVIISLQYKMNINRLWLY